MELDYLFILFGVLFGGLAGAALFIHLVYRLSQYGKPRPNVRKSL